MLREVDLILIKLNQNDKSRLDYLCRLTDSVFPLTRIWVENLKISEFGMNLLTLTTIRLDVSDIESKSGHKFSHLAVSVLMDKYL